MEKAILIAALAMFFFGIFSNLADRTPITAPMVFVSVGILLGPLCLDLFHLQLSSDIVKVLAELTLVLVLFIEASTINMRTLFKEYAIPLRLLFVGLPLTMILGIGVAFLFYPGMNPWVLVVMALILSPTDAALGQAVVNSKEVPRITRDAIAVESGLNDGFALPPILACIAAIAATETASMELGYWIKFVAMQLLMGALIGALTGWLGGKIIIKAIKRAWINKTFIRLSSIALAIIAYALSTKLQGNGFIAAFFGGLFVGPQIASIRSEVYEFGETEGQQLTLFVFLLFGLVLVPISAHLWDWTALFYALCSLSIIRFIPVAISLIGSKISLVGISFIGWFGPRGMASILYLLLFVAMVGAGHYDKMLSVITLTVLLSIFLHGLSAVPLSKLYGRYARRVKP